ncbi:MAG: OmpA family protein [Bacteroidales bacterium]|nr:OmpA family protein [Bacteroidales bacterium]
MAETEVQNSNYLSAVQYYEAALELNPRLTEVQFKLADALRNAHCFDRALTLYSSLADKQFEQYPLSVYYAAQLSKYFKNYKDALRYFKHFLTLSAQSSLYYKTALYELKVCNDIINSELNANFDIVLEDEAFNRAFFMYGLTQFDSLFYISGIPLNSESESGWSRLFTSQNTTATLKLIRMLDKYNVHVSDFCFLDTTVLLFSMGTVVHNKNVSMLYSTKYIDNEWTKPIALPPAINCVDCNVKHPSVMLFGGKKYLLFSSNMSGGYGEQDIWYAPTTENMYFGKPENAGSTINTAANEICPFYDNNYNKLYFSSEWHGSYGGFDIFESDFRLDYVGSVKNLGWGVNSSFNDLYFTKPDNDRRAFFTSNRDFEEVDSVKMWVNKIYSYQVPDILKTLMQNDTILAFEESIDNQLDAIIEKSKKAKEKEKSSRKINLYFEHDLPMLGDTTRYETLLNNYLSTQEVFTEQYLSYPFASEADQYEIEQFFKNDIKGGYEQLTNTIDSVKTVLEKGKKAEIFITAYTSKSGKLEYNNALAQRRADVVKHLLDNKFSTLQTAFSVVINTPVVQYSDKQLNEKTDIHEHYRYTTRSAYMRRVQVEILVK